MIEDTLESVHYVAGQAQGEIALDLLALYNSLPVPKETNDEQ